MCIGLISLMSNEGAGVEEGAGVGDLFYTGSSTPAAGVKEGPGVEDLFNTGTLFYPGSRGSLILCGRGAGLEVRLYAPVKKLQNA